MSTIIKEILVYFEQQGPMSPGDAAQKLNAPRYKVLATIQCLSELGFLEPLYSRGSYKIYQISLLGKKALEKMNSEESLRDILEESLIGANPLKNNEKEKVEA